ncbi:dihydropyrimidinase [Tistlia consotensis]|uniref:Dihydropyrimidinase n=1 Tax=Tistlia consotensis USBA 355 TaxID=560819 RepID=A0A1Y6BBP5_9PROT|nr:dihydropyrimidinase [Tistlia consotensis]SME92591.1 dihydropyrimidinase [Tistlia consotensis USBA 355]SNR28107.1 dihydropyrimidinase [Tistlia consotensis]
MREFDLVVRGGTVVTAAQTMDCDVGIVDGKVAALMAGLPPGRAEVDATGRLVLPGGVEAHCHIEQKSSFGLMTSDDFYSATVSAAFGGNTTVLPFAAQHRGQSLLEVVEDYERRAGEKAVIDYSYHLIVSDPTEAVLNDELPALIRRGLTSFKVYTTYDLLKLDDYQILEVLAVARREGALVMVHAENHEMIRWLTERLLARGHVAPRYHGIGHSRLAEGEATSRVISLSELLDVPLLVVHVSCRHATEAIRDAQTRGLRIYGETCPQYLFLTLEDLDRAGMDGAMYCCSPPPRDAESQAAIWNGLQNGTFQVFSSDHAPYAFDETAKLAAGPDAPFHKIANGLPGIELRMPLLFSEGVRKGRIDLQRFVELTSTNAARLYGLFPRKGTIAIGGDADLAIWEPEKRVEVQWELLHDRVGYTPYAGRQLTGWPTTVVNRGRVVVDGGRLLAERGSGRFVPRGSSSFARPRGVALRELDETRNFGAALLD